MLLGDAENLYDLSRLDDPFTRPERGVGECQ